jgi:hypothetical protein
MPPTGAQLGDAIWARNRIAQMYAHNVATPSDINEHLETLYDYARHCDSIVECGVRTAVSTVAFAHGLLDPVRPRPEGSPRPKLTCVDLSWHPNIGRVQVLCTQAGIDFEFIQGNDVEVDFGDAVHMVFIDTWHVYPHMRSELRAFHPKAEVILAHDTEVDAKDGESKRERMDIPRQARESGYSEEEIGTGLDPAIREFLEEHPEWVKEAMWTNCNGLTALRRVDSTRTPFASPLAHSASHEV